MSEHTLKAYHEGTHRMMPPAVTMQRLQPLLKQMGITRVANVTGLDSIGIPVVTACRPNARSVSVSQGKGLDLESAQVSGIMEAIELYHAEYIDADLKLASFNEIQKQYNIVDVKKLPRLSISRFHADMRLLWIKGVELYTNKSIWVPFDMVHANYTLPLPQGSGAFVMSTNGLASGNHAAEAITHGLCELIERDASTLWYLNRHRISDAPSNLITQRILDLNSVNDQNCRSLLDLFEQANMQVTVWDITSDIGIASFYCHINDQGAIYSTMRFPAAGAGTHPCREIALSRALTEAAQTRLTFISGSRDDIQLDIYKTAGKPQPAAAQNESQTDNDVVEQLITFEQIASWQHDCFEDDIDLILQRLKMVGIEQVALIDLSKPEFEVPVYRVVAPGLEAAHDVPGFVAGERAQRSMQSQQNSDLSKQN